MSRDRSQPRPDDPAAAIDVLVDHYDSVRRPDPAAARGGGTQPGAAGDDRAAAAPTPATGANRSSTPALDGLRGVERERRVAQFVAVTDIYTWKLLRRDRGLSRRQTKLALRELLEPLMEATLMARILAYTSPALGHLFPAMPILEELRGRGHEVALRTLASQVEGCARARLRRRADRSRRSSASHTTTGGPGPRSGAGSATLHVFRRASRARRSATCGGAIEEERARPRRSSTSSPGARGGRRGLGRPPGPSFCPFPPPFPSRDAPPFGPGLPPGRVAGRDALRDGRAWARSRSARSTARAARASTSCARRSGSPPLAHARRPVPRGRPCCST